MVYCWFLTCSQQLSYHKLHRHCHFPAPLRGCATGGRGFQHGYINARRGHREYIMAAIAASFLEEMFVHFSTCQKPWERGRRTWCMRYLGRELRYRTDYLLGD